MTFDEDFPSLTEFVTQPPSPYKVGSYLESEIKSCCLDKQRVREVLNSIDSCLPFDTSDVIIATIAESIRKARRELGL